MAKGTTTLENRSELTVPQDTLKKSIKAGQVLIFALPDSVDGLPVEAYEPIRLPALSWLVDGAFFWRTQLEDIGMHTFEIRRKFPTNADTLFLMIHVQH